MKNLLRHPRHHAPAYVAMVVSLVVAPTSAYAVATIRSADIVDGEVKAPDLALNAVRGPKVLDGSLVNQDLAAGTIAGDKVADGSLSGTDIADGTVGGADVNESSLSAVPSAVQGGVGRFGSSGNCDPESATFITCSSVQVFLPQSGRLLVIGTARASHESDSDRFFGACRVSTNAGAITGSTDSVDGDAGGNFDDFDSITVMGVSDVLPAGTQTVRLECSQLSIGAIQYGQARVVAVALSSS